MEPYWKRDYFWPVIGTIGSIVSLVVPAIISFSLPKLFPENLELSYEIEGPVGLLDEQVVDERVDGTDIRIMVNGKETQRAFIHWVRVWNSGEKRIEMLPVTFEFRTNDDGFEILSLTHKTTPEGEFGPITELETKKNSRRIQYAFLNPGNEDVVSFLSTRKSQIKVHANPEGRTINRTKEKPPGFFVQPWYLVVFGLECAVLALAFRHLFARLARRQINSETAKSG